ncbi:hypothetical protein PMAC_001633 [Pneumocystis sp. 'macacae']|nr:hypothetical protein PMAC_001633 [Pneumocystis sp. 'macacae']
MQPLYEWQPTQQQLIQHQQAVQSGTHTIHTVPIYTQRQDLMGFSESVYPVYTSAASLDVSASGQRTGKSMYTPGLIYGYGTHTLAGASGVPYASINNQMNSQTGPQTTAPINPSISTSINGPINPSISTAINGPINPSISTAINGPINPSISTAINGPINPSISTAINGPINPSISTAINGPINASASTGIPSSFLPSSNTVAAISPQLSSQPHPGLPFYTGIGYFQKVVPSTRSSASTTLTMPSTLAKQDVSDGFMSSLMEFMSKRGTPITAIPYIGEQQVNLTTLYIHVMRLGGKYKVIQTNAWPSIAQALGINLVPSGIQQLAECYETYLAPYEEAWTYNQQLLMQQQAQVQQPPSDKVKRGFIQEQNDLQKNMIYNAANKVSFHSQEHPIQLKPALQSTALVSGDNSQSTRNTSSKISSTQIYKPKKRVVETYGGFDMELITKMSLDLEGLKCKPPRLHELGTVNIYALIMSIKSRLHSEVNRALDVFTIITGDKRWGLPLAECGELLDCIIEMADDEYSLLIEDIRVMDETMSVLSYEQMMNLCYDEIENLIVNYRPGSLGYNKIKSAEKILCIATILRNLSFTEENQDFMAKNISLLILIEHLIIMISKTDIPEISYRLRLDLAKDLIILLSNISQSILIENVSTARAIISLIIAFSPYSNISSNPNKILFTSYNPTLHPYLPAAVDTLAKLFARSFPNRHIFTKVMISISSKQCLRDNIFIRALLLCISPIPLSDLAHPIHTCEMRLALLEHCTLAAETIVSIFPKGISLARSLLFADDSFFNNLIRLACLLSSIGGGQSPHQFYNIESNPFSRFARRIMNILHILIKKAKKEKPLDEMYRVFFTTSKKEQLLGSLLTPHMDGMVIKNLWSLVEEDNVMEIL